MAKKRYREGRTNVSVPAEIHVKFKLKCTLLGVSLREAMIEILTDWVSDLPDLLEQRKVAKNVED